MRAAPLLVLLAIAASAQPVDLQVRAGVDALSGAYADGRSVSATLTAPRPGGWARLDVGAEDRFGQRALVYGAAAALDLGPRWLVVGGAGSSSGGLVHPRLHASLGVGRKWGAKRHVLTTATVGLVDSRDVHRDLTALGEVVVYGDGLIAQIGARATLSQPGDALGYGGHVSVTVPTSSGRVFRARFGAGRESYLLVEPSPLDVSFRSGEGWVEWEEPVGRQWAVTARTGVYANPYYSRVGVLTGVRRRF